MEKQSIKAGGVILNEGVTVTQKGADNMSEIYSSHVLYYSLQEDFCNWINFEIELNKKIDAEILKQAINDSLARYPYMAVKLMIKNEKYVLEKNDKLADVYSFDEKPLYLFGAKNNDYMFRFAIQEGTLHVRFFQGLCDTRGFEPFLKTVLFEYFNHAENRLHTVKNVNTIDSPISHEEILDPHFGKTFEGGNSAVAPQMKDVYQLPEDFDSLGRRFSYKIEVNSQEFNAFAKASENSPKVIISLFMANAILSENSDAVDRILAGVVVDTRPIMGVTKSHHSSIAILGLHHNKKLTDMPLATQATCYHDMILLKSDPNNILPSLCVISKFGKKIDATPTLEAKRSLTMSITQSRTADATFIASYTDTMDFGEISNYMESFYVSVDMKYYKMLIEISCINNKFFINVMQGFENDRYVKALIRQLESANIHCVCREMAIMETMIADCPLT